MSVRVYSSGNRLIISKAGYDASPSLADANKVFDSAWLFAGSIITKGIYAYPADGNPRTIAFPQAQAEAPACYSWRCYPPGYWANDPNGNLAVQESALTHYGGTGGVVSTTTGLVLPGGTAGNIYKTKSDRQNATNGYLGVSLVAFGM